MRRIADHRFEGAGFNEAVRGFVKNSPWWMFSIFAHAVILAVLSLSGMGLVTPPETLTLQSSVIVQQVIPKPMETPPLPKPPPEEIRHDPVPTVDDVQQQSQTDTADPHDSTAGVEGLDSAPFDGMSKNGYIGIGGDKGGGHPGMGGRRNFRGSESSKFTQDAVEAGLKWLALHQDLKSDGKWDCDEFMKHDPASDRCDGAGNALYDQGVTGLALLAFLGADYTDRGSDLENPYAKHVRAGLRYLMRGQDSEGCFSPRASQHFMYNHAIATLAMCEAYALTRNPLYQKPAQDGVNFIANARNPYLAWRYNPRGGENDTSVTGWCVMALKSGKFANLDVDIDAFRGARKWIDKVTEPELGIGGYQSAGQTAARPEGLQDRFPQEKSQAMTAVCVLCRIFLGENPGKSAIIRKGVARMSETLPDWDPKAGCIDMYYWYYATLAMYQVGGTPWERWNKAMKVAIVGHQHPRPDGARAGSWDPIGPWGPDGGRVYSTAVLTMCLEVYYRYDRVFGIGIK